MNKNNRQKLVKAFAVIAIIGLLLSSFAGGLISLF